MEECFTTPGNAKGAAPVGSSRGRFGIDRQSVESHSCSGGNECSQRHVAIVHTCSGNHVHPFPVEDVGPLQAVGFPDRGGEPHRAGVRDPTGTKEAPRFAFPTGMVASSSARAATVAGSRGRHPHRQGGGQPLVVHPEAVSRQGEPGKEWHYSDLKAVYLIALLNFRQRAISDELRTDVALMDMKHKTPFSDKLRMVFLQLPYFTKEAEECETLFDRIIYVLKHMDVLKRMPWMAQEAVFQKLASIADVASLSKKERIAYDENLRKYRDTVAVMEGQWLEGHAKGVAEGHAKGVAEGVEENKRENARRMKTDGMSTELIAKYTGLTFEEVNSL